MKIVNQQEIAAKILSIPHDDPTIFSVTFIKRTNGELRKMVCRRGVRKSLHGGDAPYSFSENKLLPVYDIQKEQYRTVASESVQELKLHGETYQIPNARLL